MNRVQKESGDFPNRRTRTAAGSFKKTRNRIERGVRQKDDAHNSFAFLAEYWYVYKVKENDAQPLMMLNAILRKRKEVFSLTDFMRLLSDLDMRIPTEECVRFLESNPIVFPLQNDFYVTRAGAFTGQRFCFKPTKLESKNACFIPGHRCMPFVDPEMLPHDFSFYYKGKRLSKKSVEFDSSFALDFFSLYGDEFAAQYIAADPSNADMQIAERDFDLPARINLTVTSLDDLVRYAGYKYGDRITCRVIDWDKGKIALDVLPSDSMHISASDLARQDWYEKLEKLLLAYFEKCGPCASIEEQLALVFLENLQDLCTDDCGSIEECLAQSKKIAFAPFGVETRLWKADEEVPAFGEWSEALLPFSDAEEAPPLALSLRVLDSCIKDQLFCKKNNAAEIAEKFFFPEMRLTKKERENFYAHIRERRYAIEKTYNWFADFSIGDVRARALHLYGETVRLQNEIRASTNDLSRFPQQPLIILSQLSNHVLHIIELLELNSFIETDEANLSLEGMELHFDAIKSDLRNAVESETKNGFSVIK